MADTTMVDGQMVKKFHVAIFVNTGTSSSIVWKRIKKSTDNTITMNATTKDFDFIDQDKPTKEVDYYAPSLNQPLTMYKGNDDFEFMFNKFFTQASGTSAHVDVLIVFYNEATGSAYKAWKTDATLVLDNMNPVASTITANLNFAGTTTSGTATVTDGTPVFTATGVTEFVLTVTVSYSSSPVDGATVQINGVYKTTNSSGQAQFTLLDGTKYAVAAYDATHSVSEILTADADTPALALTLA